MLIYRGCPEFWDNLFCIFAAGCKNIVIKNSSMKKHLPFKEANIEEIVNGLIELTNNFVGVSMGSEVPLDYNSEWDVIIGVRRK